jgi:hypothetical protein
MKDQELLISFFTACATTWLFLILFYLIFLHRGRLFRKGYSGEYIEFIRQDYRKRMRGIAIAIPLLLLIASGIFWLIAGRPVTYNHLTIIFLIFFILVIPFPVMDYIKSKKRYKDLAYKTSAEVVFDMNHLKLHKFFSPSLELSIGILFVLFQILIIHLPSMVYVHLGIPWILYLSVLKSKYTTLPMLRDGYLYSFIFMELNYALVIFYIARYATFCQDCLARTPMLTAVLLMTIMLGRMIYYVFNFRKVYQAMSQ